MPRVIARSGPLCACGCGQQTWQRRNRYATPQCVPKADRARWASRARRRSLFAFRAARFRETVRRLAENGRLSSEALMEALADAYVKGYAAGLHAGLRRGRQDVARRSAA